MFLRTQPILLAPQGTLHRQCLDLPHQLCETVWDREKLPNYLPYPQYPTSFTAHSHHCSITYRTKPLSKIFHHWGEEHMHTAYTDSASKEPSLGHNKGPGIHPYTKNHPQLHHQLSSKFAYSYHNRLSCCSTEGSESKGN